MRLLSFDFELPSFSVSEIEGTLPGTPHWVRQEPVRRAGKALYESFMAEMLYGLAGRPMRMTGIDLYLQMYEEG